MSENHSPHTRPTVALDALIAELIVCGGVLSQIVANMAEFEAAGLSAPDSPPIGDVLHKLLSDVLEPVAKPHPAAEIETASVLLREITETICTEIFVVGMDAQGGQRPRTVAVGRTRRRRGF